MKTSNGADRRQARLVIAVLGPDGSGKTTLLNELPRIFAMQGHPGLYFHLWPTLRLHASGGGIVTDPHSRKPRGLLSSIAKLFYLVGRYNLGWLISIRLRGRRSFVYFDRYYQDILVDPRRYRMGVPKRIVRLFGLAIPGPDLFLVLDLLPEVARARKVEVSEVESERQFHAYRALAMELPNAVLVDASRAPKDVVRACEMIIRAKMQEFL